MAATVSAVGWFLGVMVVGVLSFPLDSEYQDIVNAIESRLYGGRVDPHDVGRQNSYEEWKEAFAKSNDNKLLDADDTENAQMVDIFNGHFEVVDDWPAEDLKLGQVGGLATDSAGHLHVFQRAEREWNLTTFDDHHMFTGKEDGPIKSATMLKLNKTNGAIISKWGENLFYLPHGLTIDHEGNYWMTDVAMHQVFKFEPGKSTPSLVLGKAFEPGKTNEDKERFCQPTDVAVASNGDFFVADGYCNSRVVKYNKKGEVLGVFAVGDAWIPHSIALAEDLDVVCLADRENMRILCYDAGLQDPNKLGEPEREYSDDNMGRVFAVDYSPEDGLLYAVTGPTGELPALGYSIDISENDRYKNDIIAHWEPDEQGFDQPHDLATSPDGENVYVGEIGPNFVWKFEKDEQ